MRLKSIILITRARMLRTKPSSISAAPDPKDSDENTGARWLGVVASRLNNKKRWLLLVQFPRGLSEDREVEGGRDRSLVAWIKAISRLSSDWIIQYHRR